MINSNVKKILVLAPHTDDGEFGCGGTIAKFIEQGLDVYYAAFSACKQSVLKQFPPDLVFIPSQDDLHQDHATIAMEGLRAFKQTSILCYEVPWNNISFRTSAFIHLTKKQLDTKIQALKKYKSQAHRNYASEEFIQSLARVRGVQVGTDYAETFEVIRWFIK